MKNDLTTRKICGHISRLERLRTSNGQRRGVRLLKFVGGMAPAQGILSLEDLAKTHTRDSV